MEKVAVILENANLTGFTELLSGERLCRYVVAFTHNKERSVELLTAQFEFYQNLYDNITIGWRMDHHWDVFIDIGTSTDSLHQARLLQKRYNQQAIRDTVKGRGL